MQPEASHSGNPDLARGLPPVAPPSGKFILQLFLVPGIIVTVAVAILWGFTWLAGGPRSADQYLENLRSPNADIRWRAANDLAQVLKRDHQLASDPRLALELAELLRLALTDRVEPSSPERPRPSPWTDPDGQAQKARAERDYVLFLTACLGNLTLPVGLPVLQEIAQKDSGADLKTLALRRRRAVWAIANLGDSLQRYDQLSEERRAEIVARLEEEAQHVGQERAEWARFTLEYLRRRQAQQPAPLGVDLTLAQCAKADDPFLRAMVAYAFTFWGPDQVNNELVEQTLLALSFDDGHGVRIEIHEQDF